MQELLCVYNDYIYTLSCIIHVPRLSLFSVQLLSAMVTMATQSVPPRAYIHTLGAVVVSHQIAAVSPGRLAGWPVL